MIKFPQRCGILEIKQGHDCTSKNKKLTLTINTLLQIVFNQVQSWYPLMVI